MALAGLSSVAIRAFPSGSLTAPIDRNGVVFTVALPGFLDWFARGMGLAVLVAEREVGRAGGRLMTALARRPGSCAFLGISAFALGVPAERTDMFLPWYGLFTHVALGLGSGVLVLS